MRWGDDRAWPVRDRERFARPRGDGCHGTAGPWARCSRTFSAWAWNFPGAGDGQYLRRCCIVARRQANKATPPAVPYRRPSPSHARVARAPTCRHRSSTTAHFISRPAIVLHAASCAAARAPEASPAACFAPQGLGAFTPERLPTLSLCVSFLSLPVSPVSPRAHILSDCLNIPSIAVSAVAIGPAVRGRSTPTPRGMTTQRLADAILHPYVARRLPPPALIHREDASLHSSPLWFRLRQHRLWLGRRANVGLPVLTP